MFKTENERKLTSDSSINFKCLVTCGMVFIFLTELFLGIYVYNVRSEMNQEYLKEARGEIWKSEISEILKNPKFCELYGCNKNNRDQEKKYSAGVKAYRDVLINKIKELSKTQEDELPTSRKRRQLNFSEVLLQELEDMEGWNIETSIHGCQGAIGPPGPPGRPGMRGFNGPKGEKGQAGSIGLHGLPGQKGDRGSVPDIKELKGIKGEPGFKGPEGPRGFPGIEGIPGLPGVKGDNGYPGIVGPPGLPGLAGQKGEKGNAGTDGLPGQKGDRGSVSDIKELKGIKGEPGFKGPEGPRGFPGIEGIPGLPGVKGDNGYPGIVGPPGLPGLAGQKGEKGNAGTDGLPGQKGDRGSVSDIKELKGIKGEPGFMGREGHPGFPGMDGRPGQPGVKGDRGDPGYPGIVGPPGFPGLSGQKGETGKTGAKGDRGFPGPIAIGPMGPPGIPGPQGLPGKCLPCHKETNSSKMKIGKYGDDVYSGLPNRTTECLITEVYKPIISAFDNEAGLSLMIDSNPPSDSAEHKSWKTDDDQFTLHELYRLTSNDSLNRTYDLYADFQGTSHLVDSGSFYYQGAHRKPRIIKYYLNNETTQVLTIPGLTLNNAKQLYNSRKSYLDFNVDENGLWVIFSDPESNNTAVMKVNGDDLKIQDILNVTLNHEDYEEMFIASGVLYGIKGEDKKDATISFALDLYTSKTYEIDFKLSKWIKPPLSAAYDYRNKHIRVINKDGQYSYPIKCGKKDAEEITSPKPE